MGVAQKVVIITGASQGIGVARNEKVTRHTPCSAIWMASAAWFQRVTAGLTRHIEAGHTSFTIELRARSDAWKLWRVLPKRPA